MAEKKIYKIWDRKNGCYVTGNKSKSSWSSIGWVTSKIEQEMSGGYYGYSRTAPKRSADEFEVREFKLVLENTMDGGDLFREKEEIERIRREGVNRYNATVEDIKKILPDLPIKTVKSMYKSGLFSEDLMIKLGPGIQVLADNYRYLSK